VFVKLIEMGSSVLACPAFREAERLVGAGNLFILVFESNRAILDVLPFFPPDRILAVDDSGLVRLAVSLGKAFRRLRREGVDAAIDLEGLTRASAAITYLTGARLRVGYHNFTSEGPYRGRLFTHELNYNFQHHVSLMFLAMVRALFTHPAQVPFLKEPLAGADVGLPRFEPTATDVASVRAMLNQHGFSPDRPCVLLNPNCSDLLPLRRWPLEHFVSLGKRIRAEFPHVGIVITGSRAEAAEAARVAGQMGEPGHVVSVAGQTTLRDLLTLYSLSRVLVSNDSGPCHFASLTGIRTVALFGPETPQLYGPLGAGVLSLSAGLACSPCVNMLNHRFSPCRDNRCMQTLSVDSVYQAAAMGLKA
jgi:ADP-heptose:LPS heptosyltransferase